jgi:hypothetical protein
MKSVLSQKSLYSFVTEHRCECPGCGSVLVLDGNMKNNREVCYATRAGYTEFSGLVGQIATGCPNSPAFKSRYCTYHSPFAVSPQEEGSSPLSDQESQLAAIITGKRLTRTSTFYQVCYL